MGHGSDTRARAIDTRMVLFGNRLTHIPQENMFRTERCPNIRVNCVSQIAL